MPSPVHTLTIVDESTLGARRSWQLDVRDLLEETLTLREILRRRIYQEVTEYNAQRSERFAGLVQPTAIERTLNGTRPKFPGRIDWQAQYEQAVEAFARRGYIVLVDDQHITALDTPVALHAGTEITFLKLVPLVGG